MQGICQLHQATVFNCECRIASTPATLLVLFRFMSNCSGTMRHANQGGKPGKREKPGGWASRGVKSVESATQMLGMLESSGRGGMLL